MSKKGSNNFRKAMSQLKSTRIDERLEVLNERPANSTMGLYTVTAGSTTEPVVTPGEVTRPADFTQDDSATDTTGLFDDNGTILLEGPPITNVSPDDSYILGPMSSMWYAWGNFTQIGYIRQSDRKMVNLARIEGELQDWDKVSNFTSYGQLTLEQAVWYCNEPKYQNGYANYRAFYPGPPSNTPDEFGRYYCTIVGTPKSTRNDPSPETTSPTQGGPDDVGYPWPNLSPEERKKKKKKLDDLMSKDPSTLTDAEKKALNDAGLDDFVQGGMQGTDLMGDLATLALSAATVYTLGQALSALGPAALVKARGLLRGAKNWFNKGANTRIPNESQASWRTLRADDFAQRQRISADPNSAWNPFRGMPGYGSAKAKINPRIRGINTRRAAQGKPNLSMDKINPGGFQTGPTPITRELIKRPLRFLMNLFQSYEPNGNLITESKDGVDALIDAMDKALTEVETVGEFNAILDAVDKAIQSMQKKKDSVKESKELNEETKRERRKKILREVKQPYVLREVKKEKYKFKKADKVRAKYGRTVNPDLMKQAEVPTSFKKMESRMWGKYEKEQNARASQDKKNVILDHLGGTDHVLEYIFETGREKGKKIAYGNYGEKVPKKVVRKEQMKGDNLLFIADENGKKETILQSELNDKLDQKHTEELFAKYVEPEQPLYEKLKRRLTE